MKPTHTFGVFAIWAVFLVAIAQSLGAQEASAPRTTGVPEDWSDHHLIFSRDALVQRPELLRRESRILHQARQRWRTQEPAVGVPDSPVMATGGSVSDRDWNVVLGGRVSTNMFPAKFSFDPGAPPSCSGDFVVFGLATAGTTGGRPNLVAFNNLYSGTGGLCGSAPTVLFAYNITTGSGGKIVLSPILSEDGTKIAFVESLGTSAIFHVLTWTAGQGTLAAAAAPTMTSLTFSPANNSTTSSPWIDYSKDTVYLGADNGKMYKITGVFHGTPALAGSTWPVNVSTNFRLTAPVLDANLGVLMVGSANGSLYQINTTTGALATVVVGKSGGTSPGVVAPPIVDVTNSTTFAVSANDGTSGVLVEIDTSSMTQLSKARLGQAAASGTALNLYEPAFDNNYFNDPSTGTVRLCGTGAADLTPWQYAFAFTGRTMKTTPSFSQQLLTSTAARCSGWTEFFNPNVNGGTDFFFFGLTQDCTGSGLPGGCVVARASDLLLTKVTIDGGPTGIVVDNYSTAPQASSIYFMAAKLNTAYKLTQNGLQ